MFCSSLPGFNDDGSHEQKIQQPEPTRSIGYQRAFSCCPSALACPESRHTAKAHHRYRASGPTLSRVCDGATAGHNPHQLPAARLLFSCPLPLAPGWLSLALGSLTNAPSVFPILLIHSPPYPQTTALVCAPVLPHCTLIASARAVSSHLDFAPSSSFERPAASDGAFVAISRPFPTSQTGKRIVVLAGPLLDPSLHIAIDKAVVS